ncbi:ABC transporter substrate-binding protein [Vibrio tapetis subsp. quintayensis]|uniref:substrate-binding periplasmic protein n=1 Tax=Vibrio tapetis TaxID=52443 RepID=UPI0025B45BEA|nr:ABC transporter substrate-binding protein [Vibrio tapetis]MDN3681008.1 ABC transporter substrate-binding protein [Vibrio tapetis subsp. quintayensis]
MRLRCAVANLLLFIVVLFSVPPAVASVAKFSTSNVKPWGFLGSDGKPTGLLIRVADALQGELSNGGDIVIENQLRPYPRVIHEIKTATVDFAVMFNSSSANSIAVSLGKVVDARVIIIGVADREPIASLDDLTGKMVGHIRGSKYGPDFDDHRTMKKRSLGSMKQGIDMLLNGRIYALASADQTIYYAMEQMDIPLDAITTMYTVSSIQADLYFSKESSNSYLVTPVKQALDRLRAKGTLDKFSLKISKAVEALK